MNNSQIESGVSFLPLFLWEMLLLSFGLVFSGTIVQCLYVITCTKPHVLAMREPKRPQGDNFSGSAW